MKKNIFRIAIMAIFVVTLMAGSALAAKIDGYISFTGTSKVLSKYGEGDMASIYAVQFQPYTPPGLTEEYYAIVNYTDATPTGDFRDRIPDFDCPASVCGMPPTYIPYFPTMHYYDDEGNEYENIAFQFRDETTLALLDSLQITVANPEDFWKGDLGFLFGSIAGFDFYINEITSFTSDESGYILTMYGWVADNSGALETSYAKYTFSANAADSAGNWSHTLDVLTQPDPIPEPGTLVLLGTGIMGAAIVARKKIKK